MRQSSRGTGKALKEALHINPPDGAWAGELQELRDLEASQVAEILDGIPGAWEKAKGSIEQARRGETVPLSEL